MTRSAASIERRRAYSRAWREAHAGYHAAWARSHREVESARKRRLRAIPGWRAAHETSSPRPLDLTPMPKLHTGHPLLDAARAALPDRGTSGSLLAFPLEVARQDERSEFVVAVLEGRDPVVAVAAYRRSEAAWALHRAPLFADVAA